MSVALNGLNGFGTPQDTFGLNLAGMPDLMKALTAGYNFGVTDQTGGGAFRVESLEASLKVITFSEQHIRFWKNIPKRPAFNTVEEYNVLSAYGNNASMFLPEGVMPETEDSTYNRKVALVKFMGTTRVVTHPMTLVRSAHGDVIATENRNGILSLLSKVEQALFWGNNTLAFNFSPASGGVEGIEFPGLDSQIDPNSFIDAQGAALSEGLLNDASETIAENFGQATHLYCPFKVASDFDKTLFSKERVIMPSATGGIQAGTTIQDFNSHYGVIKIMPDVFLKKHRKAQGPAPTSATSPNAPQTPASIAGATGGSTGVWKATGNVFYKVTAINRYGESAASAASSAVNVSAATLVVTLTVTNPNPISGLAPDYYNVYRSDTGATGTYFYVSSIAASSQSSAGTTITTDTGLYMTNVSTCFLGQLDPNVLAIMQLAPLMKMDLAVLGPAIRWMILLYCTFVLYQTKKWIKIINVGDLA